MSIRWLGLILVLSSLVPACDVLTPAVKPRHARKHTPAPQIAAKPATAASAEPLNVPSSGRYGLPFAWEKADSEPLGKTRGFLSDVLRDNEKYMSRGKAYFDALKKPQQPRVTVITCADSRLQPGAWDETPENDDFTIRNIGNQVLTSLGSVQYGIEHLNTPVLLILGHTGCGAVKAVLSKEQDLPKPIASELEGIKLPKEMLEASKKKFDSVWADAVIENVHHQVREALTKFGPSVVTGKLTVIGAVYDLTDAFGKGPGRIGIVDVNGNSEPKRLRAFVAAIQESKKVVPNSTIPDSQEFTVPETSLPPSNEPSAPNMPKDDLQAAFVDLPGLVTGEGTRAGK